MDTGNKTLAQLSEEGKEARYVTVEVASKLSGYTKEYLERLCALHKVNFLLWNADQYAFELDSLLKETHTILLSYEGLTFLEKDGLTAPPKATPSSDSKSTEEVPVENVVVHPSGPQIPHFVENGRLSSRESNAGMFSFTGRAVVSDFQHPSDTSDEEIHIPISVLRGAKNDDARPVLASEDIAVVQEKKPEVKAQLSPRNISTTQSHESSTPSQVLDTRVSLPVVHESRIPTSLPVHDDWEERLFGARALGQSETLSVPPAPIPPPTPLPVSSPYHPLHTSIDATIHHEDMPLFPKLIEKALPPASPSLLKEQKEHEVIVGKQTPLSGNTSQNVVPIVGSASPRFIGAIHHAFPSEHGIIPPRLPVPQQKNLPMRSPEHHLTVLESHPLMKSVGFNMSFALLFLIPSFMMLSGIFTTEKGDFPTTKANLAAVGASDEIQTESKEVPSLPSVKEEQLEFSDEVEVAEGETPHSVLVQPIFREGAGEVYEYMNARLEYNSASTSE